MYLKARKLNPRSILVNRVSELKENPRVAPGRSTGDNTLGAEV